MSWCVKNSLSMCLRVVNIVNKYINVEIGEIEVNMGA
jgi:septum formation topological specificity factor MinE